MLNTDSNTNSLGFTLDYTISKCPGNCSNNETHSNGNCGNDGVCVCHGSRTGDACQYNWCPDLCGQANNKGQCEVVCIFEIMLVISLLISFRSDKKFFWLDISSYYIKERSLDKPTRIQF